MLRHGRLPPLAFTITFPTTAAVPPLDEVSTWLNAVGEPHDTDGGHALELTALPLRLVADPSEDHVLAHFEVTPSCPLVRLVDVFFQLSLHLGSDVQLMGEGKVTRSVLWLRLADEQDRSRLVGALHRAGEYGNQEDVHKRLWAVLGALGQKQDLRWDAASGRIVEMCEVGGPNGVPLEEATFLVPQAAAGDLVPMPVKGHLHVVAWRWLSEAYPGLCEG